MGKKEKNVTALAEDFQAISTLVTRLESVSKAHREIAAAYQKYRKSGGAEISGLEKHLGIIEKESTTSSKEPKTKDKKEVKEADKTTEAKKTKMKDKK
ncbi:MAG: hypothetical protein A2X82_07655 [Geobacteraceae bacterium GWC2_55_20]|nr:MAG: hypothetical protein A2X82_07655 [Geobacteraceae bacterium GWC2_55_20]OGU18718.1 MAG: hypothetical protein A2X85_01365 [Geobacteraceae bacterium GWF2_54_21]HBA73183.1 hypothetical protein [Geobacter sp.]HCE67567.1 hypothetical protein [Geobacter sp.]